MNLKEAKRYVREHGEVTQIECRRPYAFVKVWCGERRAIGFAKVNWPDWYNRERGIAIARGKAEADLARRLVAETQELDMESIAARVSLSSVA